MRYSKYKIFAIPESLFVGVKAIATGWGSISEARNHSCRLMEVEVPVLSNNVCKETKYDAKMIADSMLCAGYPAEGGKDTCQVRHIDFSVEFPV
jgi:hypothetical protein